MVFAGQLAAWRQETAFDQAEDMVVDLLPDRRVAARSEDDIFEAGQQIDALVWAGRQADVRFHA